MTHVVKQIWLYFRDDHMANPHDLTTRHLIHVYMKEYNSVAKLNTWLRPLQQFTESRILKYDR